MHLGQLLIALLIASTPISHAVEILSQQIEISSSAHVNLSNGSSGAMDQDSRGNVGVGDRSLQSSTQTSFSDVAVSSFASINLRRTNSAAADVFHIESTLTVHSEDFRPVINTQLTTRASAVVSVTLYVRSASAFRYSLQKAGIFAAPGSGGVTITTPNGNILVNLGWTTGTTEPAESTGVLPAGDYTIRFFTSANADGVVSPALVNHIGGNAETSLTLTFTPAVTVPTTPPALSLRRNSTNRLVLELSNLQPGTFYIIERADSLQPNSWQFLFNLFAAGTNAVWTDTLRIDTPTSFYRLRY